MTTPPNDEDLKTTEHRLARLSVLQELTVTALDLFDPDSSADPFLHRVAERLGCLAALWVAMAPGTNPTLLGAAGLSEASRALPIASVRPGDTDPTALSLPYPELARAGMTRWHFYLEEAGGEEAPQSLALLLWFDAQLAPPEEYRPAVERLVGVLRTVWMHRRLAEDLRRSYAELARAQLALVERERLAAVGELSAVVAHEVRNPLAVIFNCIGTLEKQSAPPEERAALLGILAEEANRLNDLVSELLDFARPGEVLLESESLEEVVAGAIAAVRVAEPRVESDSFDIELEVTRPLPPLLLDARLVRRAVINLVCNAVQSMPDGGRIVVRVSEDALDGRPAARIEVTDDGPGIPRATQARIFEPFFTTKASGTGLGLSIVKRVTEAHHGELTVFSEGSGTTFTIRLPSFSRDAAVATPRR
jgi:signal transduction histidine kinase